MVISTLDVSFRTEEMQKASHSLSRPVEVLEDLHGSVKSKSGDIFFTSTKLRKRRARFMAQDETEDDITVSSDEE